MKNFNILAFITAAVIYCLLQMGLNWCYDEIIVTIPIGDWYDFIVMVFKILWVLFTISVALIGIKLWIFFTILFD